MGKAGAGLTPGSSEAWGTAFPSLAPLVALQGVPACDPRRARVGAVALSSAAATRPASVSSAQRRGTRQPPTDGLGGAGYAERMQQSGVTNVIPISGDLHSGPQLLLNS